MTAQPEDSGSKAGAHTGSRGFVLVLVLALMATAVIATTAMVLTERTGNTVTAAARVIHTAQAHATAEAGIVRLIHALRAAKRSASPATSAR